jgi:hypothetical protein
MSASVFGFVARARVVACVCASGGVIYFENLRLPQSPAVLLFLRVPGAASRRC